MKFYVFGGDSDIIYGSEKTALFMSENLDVALERFNAINSNRKYKNTYLICDFEINKKGNIFKPGKIVYGQDRIPFLIVADYHEDEETILTNRTDTIILKARGFNQQFNNNIKAVQQFEKNLANHISSELFIKYKYYNDKEEVCRNTSFIASTSEVVASIDKNYKLGKIILDELFWEQDNDKREIKVHEDGSMTVEPA